MGVLAVWMSLYYVPEVPTEAITGHCVVWNWSYRLLQATMWVLGIKHWSARRVLCFYFFIEQNSYKVFPWLTI